MIAVIETFTAFVLRCSWSPSSVSRLQSLRRLGSLPLLLLLLQLVDRQGLKCQSNRKGRLKLFLDLPPGLDAPSFSLAWPIIIHYHPQEVPALGIAALLHQRTVVHPPQRCWISQTRLFPGAAPGCVGSEPTAFEFLTSLHYVQQHRNRRQHRRQLLILCHCSGLEPTRGQSWLLGWSLPPQALVPSCLTCELDCEAQCQGCLAWDRKKLASASSPII